MEKYWIARDEDGFLRGFKSKPYRTEIGGVGKWVCDKDKGVIIADGGHQPIKWENEPIEVKIELEQSR